MKAIGFKTSLPITDDNSFILFETAKPAATGKNLLVKIEAVSVNPVDYKVRQNSAKNTELEKPKIIGWDAVGTVESIGEDVTLFQPGDKVYYAGDLTKPGCNAEYQLIDERIVALAPKSISASEAAALPLTALTAWEILFTRLRIDPVKDKNKTILIIGGAGGVGSIAIQLAKHIAGLTVLTTASRSETIEWCKQCGADYVLNHNDLVNEVHNSGFRYVDFILDFVDANGYWDAMVELIKPQGHIGSITGSSEPVALNKLKNKSVSFSWELMYTRSMFETEDMIEQHNILVTIAKLIDEKKIFSTLKYPLKGFSVENFKLAHALLESGKAIGKIVIEY